MKFAHMADLHIGGWSDPKMKEVNMETFRRAIDICIQEKVDFILFAGDIFNTAIPQIDLIKETTAILKSVKDVGVPVYVIPGSHDFSPSGKTMLEVLEKAGLLVNVVQFNGDTLKFTEDEKTKVKITGLLGRKGGLDRIDYEHLNRKPLEEEEGFKIFMFHTALEEFKPADLEDMEAQSVAALPGNFQYYAGGHVHYIFQAQHGKGMLTYPGPLYPNNFKELEQYRHGGFFIVDEHLNQKRIDILVKGVLVLHFDASGKSAFQVQEEIEKKLAEVDVKDKIVLMRVGGILKQGRPTDIPFKDIFAKLDDAYFVMKNTSRLQAEEIEGVKVEMGTVEQVEHKVLETFQGQMPLEDEKELLKVLMLALDKEKAEGEKVADFEKRVLDDALKALSL